MPGPSHPDTDADADAGRSSRGARAVGERAIMNTLYRSGGEIVGRMASLLLFAETGRVVGENGLGAFVFALAYLGFVMVAVDLGLDRYLLRAIARTVEAANELFFNVLGLKVLIAAPLFALGLFGLHLLGYSHEAQETAWFLAPGIFADSVARTQLSLFLAHERGGPPSLADATQRVLSAALGIVALRAGYGVPAVAAAYSAGSTIGVVIGFVLLHRTVGLPTLDLTHRSWRRLAVGSVPFAAQDAFTLALAKVDTLILSLIASQAAVGRYGAAYRLFESTLFVTYALAGAFSAMYTYLGPDTDPPLRSAFQRSVKLALVALMPVTVAFAVLADPICRLIYGAQFASAGPALRTLAPAVVLMGVVTLCNSLMLSRERPRQIALLTVLMAAINIALNLVLIPPYSDSGAAAAMLITELIYVVLVLRLAHRTVSGIQWMVTALGALTAGGAMTAVSLSLENSLLGALLAGSAVYVLILIVVERLVSPLDVQFVTRMVRRRISRAAPLP